MVLHVSLELILQLLDFSILDIYQLSQAIELSLKFLILRAHILAQMADLIVESLLEFIIYKLDLLILLLDHM